MAVEAEKNNQIWAAGLRILLDCSSDMIFFKDTDLVYLAASRGFARMVGYERGEELEGKTDFEIFSPELAKKYTEDDRSILARGVNAEDYIEPLPEQAGRKSYSSTSKYLLRGADGRVLGLLGVSRDVTAEIALEAERESSRLSRQMFDSVLEADLTENKLLRTEGSGWVQRFAQDVGDSSFSDAVRVLSANFIHPDYTAAFADYYQLERLRAEYALGNDEFSHITYLRDEEQIYRWVEFRSRVYHSRISDTLRITTFLTDMDEDVRQRQRLQKKAVTDALTGLHNRDSMLSGIAGHLREGAGQSHALLFIDLDCFKQVNDRWGHRLGDVMLQKTAERLQKFFGDEALLGRIGGDEFLVFLPAVLDECTVAGTARALVKQLPFRYCEGEVEVCITYSIGVSFCHGGETTLEELCDQADRAMYRAKERGRNQVFFYEELPGG